MKTFIKNICITVCVSGLLFSPALVPSAQAAITTNNPNRLQLNFRDVPLETVLNYFSETADFIIMLDTHIGGNVTIVSPHAVSPDEAVNLLNTELSKKNYTAIRDGRILNIVTKQDAKTSYIPVKVGNNPEAIPNNDEMVTWIIPVRFSGAQELAANLSPFVSSETTIIANESGNLILLTDTQSHIRHLAKIILAVDNSAQTETEIRVFPMQFANPSDMVALLNSVFPDNSSSGDAFIQFGFDDGGGNANSSQSDRIKAATKVAAEADGRIQAVIVAAPKNLMNQIAAMMTRLDVASPRDQKVFVYHLKNGDPNQVATVLQGIFQGSAATATGASASQTSLLQQRAESTLTTPSSSTSSTTTTTSGATSGGGF